MTLVQCDGVSRSFRAANVTAKELQGAVHRNVDRSARIMTDQFRSYWGLDRAFTSHETVDHSQDEYVRGEVHTNTVEGFFANLKRGINGVYHHVSEAQLPRYLDEFDFRYSTRNLTDGQRTVQALIQSEGKRLRYEQTI